MLDVASVVKDLRTKLGYSQQAFATRLGLSISTIVRAEAGREPSSDILYQMAMLAGENGLLEIARTLSDHVIADTGRTGLRLLPDVYINLVEAVVALGGIPTDKLIESCSDKALMVATMQAILDAMRKIDAAKEIIASLDAVTPVAQRMLKLKAEPKETGA